MPTPDVTELIERAIRDRAVLRLTYQEARTGFQLRQCAERRGRAVV